MWLLTKLDFVQSLINLYLLQHLNKNIILLVYVDNMSITAKLIKYVK